jgi:hypothetical protein
VAPASTVIGGDDHLHSIPEDRALNDIGAAGLKEIRDLRDWLFGNGPRAPLRFRYAPSIISRGEAELLGLSMPRFAIRVYLDEVGRRNFVNARRIEEFADRVKPFVPRRSDPGWKRFVGAPDESYTETADGTTPEALVAKAHSVGDCVLDPRYTPRTQGFQVLTTPLRDVYGERPSAAASAASAGRAPGAVPFVRYFSPLSGGMCAQSACFMATTLLQHHHPEAPRGAASGAAASAVKPAPPRIHGVSEVTALAQGESFHELDLSGLTWYQIAAYLVTAGRACLTQRYLGRAGGPYDGRALALVLRAYVRSGMPVIFPINCSCMCDRNTGDGADLVPGIYRSNLSATGFAEIQLDGDYRAVDHTVVVVGCGSADRSDDFLINDPRMYPFVRASARQLFDCVNDGRIGYTRWRTPRKWKTYTLLPVTPAAVAIGLEPHDEEDAAHTVRIAGMLDLAHRLQHGTADWQGRPYPQLRHPFPDDYAPGEWRLFPAADVADHDRLDVERGPGWMGGRARGARPARAAVGVGSVRPARRIPAGRGDR